MSPLFFILYINSFFDQLDRFGYSLYGYADDLGILTSSLSELHRGIAQARLVLKGPSKTLVLA